MLRDPYGPRASRSSPPPHKRPFLQLRLSYPASASESSLRSPINPSGLTRPSLFYPAVAHGRMSKAVASCISKALPHPPKFIVFRRGAVAIRHTYAFTQVIVHRRLSPALVTGARHRRPCSGTAARSSSPLRGTLIFKQAASPFRNQTGIRSPLNQSVSSLKQLPHNVCACFSRF